MLYGPNGQVIQSYKKATPPAFGPAYGDWAGRDVIYNQMPGGSVLQFNLDRLTLQDFRAMRYYPQINSSLCLLTFMLHQVDWHMECDDSKIAAAMEEIIRPVWTRLIRAMSQSFTFGFSPIAIEYENDLNKNRIVISKFKDLIPEECKPVWKEVKGQPTTSSNIAPKYKIFDGIDQVGTPNIPVENSLWYPLLMENGNYFGRKLLKAAFAPWYFSTLIHLFANRYYERFGEPTPIGRAPFDEEYKQPDGSVVTGKQAIEMIVNNLRNRGAVTLPSDTKLGNKNANGTPVYEYSIEYLESQMRGADFERYLTRLDQEMSLALFTPLLMMSTGDVGSNSLGVQHVQTWLWLLNALAGDLKEYIDNYPIKRLKNYNFGENAPDCYWVPKKMGKENAETLRAIITSLVGAGSVKPDINELGQAIGMNLTEIQQVTQPPTPPGRDQLPRGGKTTPPKTANEPRATGRQISNRVRTQIEKAWRENRLDNLNITLGYRKRMIQAYQAEGLQATAAENATNGLYDKIESWVADVAGVAHEFAGPDDFMSLFDRHLENCISDAE